MRLSRIDMSELSDHIFTTQTIANGKKKRKNRQLRGNSSFTKDSLKFAENHDEAIHLQIRRA